MLSAYSHVHACPSVTLGIDRTVVEGNDESSISRMGYFMRCSSRHTNTFLNEGGRHETA